MRPMTDRELASLFRKHVPDRGADSWGIDPRAEFVGSRFYHFARELEHSALASGMLAALDDPSRLRRTQASGGLAGWLVALFGLLKP